VRDIRIQPQWDDLLIATHGRSLYVMDDIRALRMLPNGTGRAFVLAPRVSYEYNLHSDDEGTYTDYSGDNPPYGAIITYYLTQEIKPAPEIQILDAHRRVIRTIEGTHKVGGKEQPRVSNKIGINRYVWDYQIDGPTKWYGAAKPQYQGPNEGPGVPPGHYFVRMTVSGKTYELPFTVKADPDTHFTQAEFEDAYAFGVKYTRQYGVINAMLNGLDSVKKELGAAKSNAKTKSNTALQSQIAAALAQRDSLFHELTADYHNDEDSIQRPGALREDFQGLGFFGQGVITPAVRDYANRVEVAYLAAVRRYNAYVRSLSAINSALKSAGLKTPSAPEVKP
jgi:hypothetical protein